MSHRLSEEHWGGGQGDYATPRPVPDAKLQDSVVWMCQRPVLVQPQLVVFSLSHRVPRE